MFYITGDTHGQFDRILTFIERMELKEDDAIIILGDAGFNYYNDKRDAKSKKIFQNVKTKIFSIHGNHEMRPTSVGTYHLEDFCGGKVYVEDAFPNLLFGKDGEIYNFEGLKTIVIGGAYSVDKFYRLERGYGWFADEQPSQEIKDYVEKQLSDNDWKVDVVLSHTCPESLEPTEWFLSFIDQSEVDKSTEAWLETIRQRLTYKYWFCGHFHGRKKTPQIRFFFEDFDVFPYK